MSLHRLIYCSRQALPPHDVDFEVGRIIRASIANNRAVDVTGLLLVHQGWFVQVLEGGYTKVHALYDKIAADVRHAGASILTAGPADGRAFGEWDMCARSTSDIDGQILDGLDQRGGFEPTKLTGSSAMRLLRTVAQVQKRAA
jgi:hypothetical protein